MVLNWVDDQELEIEALLDAEVDEYLVHQLKDWEL